MNKEICSSLCQKNETPRQYKDYENIIDAFCSGENEKSIL